MVFTVKCLGGEFIKRILKNIMSHASLKLEKIMDYSLKKLNKIVPFRKLPLISLYFGKSNAMNVPLGSGHML